MEDPQDGQMLHGDKSQETTDQGLTLATPMERGNHVKDKQRLVAAPRLIGRAVKANLILRVRRRKEQRGR